MVSWWRAEGNALDQVGVNHGTLVGNTTFGTGPVGLNFTFDGNTDAVQLGNPTNLQLQNFTIEAWIRRASLSVSSLVTPDAELFCFGSGGYGFGMWNDGRLFLTKVDVDNAATSTGITDTSVHHVAVTKSGTSVMFYIDGVGQSVPAYDSVFTFSTPVAIGARGENLNNSFFGSIDELAVFSRALSGSEIQTIYLAGAAGKCTVPTAPVIISQPTNQTATVGNNPLFSVLVSGTAPLAYQWMFNGDELPGATDRSLTLVAVQAAQAGSYSVRITNSLGSVTSSNAQLVVNPPPPCIAAPAGLVSVWAGEGNASDSVGVNNGVPVGGVGFASGEVAQGFSFNGTSAYISIPGSSSLNVGAGDGMTIEGWIKPADLTRGQAVIEWNNGAGAIGAQLWISIPQYGGIGSIFANLTDTSGSDHFVASAENVLNTTNFQHVALTFLKTNGTAKLFLNGTRIALQNLGPFTPQTSYAVTLGNRLSGPGTGSFYSGLLDELSLYNRALTEPEVAAIFNAGQGGKCVATNPPYIFIHPANQTVVVGEPASFSVTAGGTPPLSYQWQFEGTNIDGATGSALALPAVQFAQAGSYRVVITNSYGSTESSNALLTVNPVPPCSTPPTNLISWWRAEANPLDQIGLNNGTLIGNATFGTGRVGQGFVFDGNGDAVQLGNPASLRLQNFTIEAWIKRSSTTASSLVTPDAELFCYGSGGYGFGMWNDGRLFLTKVDVDNAATSTGITDTNFHHVAVTKSGASVWFYIDGVGQSMPAYNSVFTFSSTVAIGARGENLNNSFYGSIDDLAVYNRALSSSEIQAIYVAGGQGKCAVPVAPFFVSQPASQTVTIGNSVTLSTTAAGTLPLGYQWSFNGQAITDATASSLSFSPVQLTNSGAYTVTVTNQIGSVTSSNAVLTVNFPAAFVRVKSVTNGVVGSPVSVPITISANGNENALSFSLSFPNSRLTFNNVSLGSDANGAALLVNTSQIGSGRVGIALALPTGTALSAGLRELVKVNFTATIATTSANANINFTDIPIVRQLSDVGSHVLPANYLGGFVSIAAVDFEGDVSPRPNGDRAVTVTDWVLVGRYAAGLDSPTNASEFQRADCAPRSDLGNGEITITDWVQAGRYAALLDPLTPVGGPTSQVTLASAPVLNRGPKYDPNGPTTARLVVVTDGLLRPGQPGTVSVNLQSQGDENALGFSLSFDPARLTYAGASLGGAANGAILNINSNQLASGKLGMALALSAGTAFAAGSDELVKVTFRASSVAGNWPVAFIDQPIHREVSDVAAVTLVADFVNGTVTISPPPSLNIVRSGSNLTLTWPSWATNFVLQQAETLAPAGWTNLPVTIGTSNDESVVNLPMSGAARFFRLIQP